MSDSIRLISWNVNGIRAVAKKGFHEWLHATDPDILCLQETKAAPEQLSKDLLEIPGYHSYFNAAERKGYSGVAVYSKLEPSDYKTIMEVDRFDHEGRILALTFPKFTLLNVYFPNGSASLERLQYKLEFYEAFLDYMDHLRDQGQSIILCGDLNTAHQPIDLARPKENQKNSGFLAEERVWLDKFIEHGYLDTFRLFCSEGGHYTWWDQVTRARLRNVGWRIDYFWVSPDLQPNIEDATILPEVQGSDHCPIGLELTGL